MSGFPLYLMRHGAPAVRDRMLGHGDCAATAAGIAACVAQAAPLADVRLVTSDLARARACAAAIGVPAVDARWRELDFGAWDGKATAEIEPAALARFWNDPDGAPPPGGERWSALCARVDAAVAALPPEPTLVVTHGGPMRAALHRLCGFPLAQTWAFELPYAAVLALSVWEGGEGAPRTAQVAGLWA